MVVEDSDPKDPGAAPDPPAPSPARGKRLLLLGIAGLVLVAALAATAFLLFRPKGEDISPEDTEALLKADAEGRAEASAKSAGNKADEKDSKPDASGGVSNSLVLKMEPIVANLNEPNLRRMVSLTLVVEGKNKAALAEVEKSTYRITDAIIKLLSNKTQADLRSEAGKDLLLLEIRSRIDQIIGKDKVAFVGYQQFYFFQ